MTSYEKLSAAINMAAPGPNGKIAFLDSDGIVQCFHLLDMTVTPAPVSVTCLFIDICTRDVTFEEAVARVGEDCLKAGIFCLPSRAFYTFWRSRPPRRIRRMTQKQPKTQRRCTSCKEKTLHTENQTEQPTMIVAVHYTATLMPRMDGQPGTMVMGRAPARLEKQTGECVSNRRRTLATHSKG